MRGTRGTKTIRDGRGEGGNDEEGVEVVIRGARHDVPDLEAGTLEPTQEGKGVRKGSLHHENQDRVLDILDAEEGGMEGREEWGHTFSEGLTWT